MHKCEANHQSIRPLSRSHGSFKASVKRLLLLYYLIFSELASLISKGCVLLSFN